MSLSLTVTSYKGQPPLQPMSISLDQNGATIGRASDNHWILPDPDKYLSSHHAVINYANGAYRITDTSSNGVYVLPSATPLGRNNSVELQDGDQLAMGEYTIAVRIAPLAEEPLANTLAETPFGGTDNHQTFVDDPFMDLGADPLAAIIEDEAPSRADPFSSIDATPAADDFFSTPDALSTDDAFGAESNHAPSLHEAFSPNSGHIENHFEDAALAEPDPLPEGSNSFLPENWFEDDEPAPAVPSVDERPDKPLKPTEAAQPLDAPIMAAAPRKEKLIKPKPPSAKPKPAPKPAAETAPSTEAAPATAEQPSPRPLSCSDQSVIESFCQGAQINTELAAQFDADTFVGIGRMFRTAMEGAMEVLLARTRIKNEMRLDVTTIRAAENNPIKFSVSVDEVFARLLTQDDNSGYMDPVDAVQEAFDDIKIHQVAVIAGMQTALQSVLQRFNPDRLEQRLQKESPISASIPIHRQATLWRQFEQLYEAIESEAQDDFNHLFGRAFAKAYEEQIQRLKSRQDS